MVLLKVYDNVLVVYIILQEESLQNYDKRQIDVCMYVQCFQMNVPRWHLDFETTFTLT